MVLSYHKVVNVAETWHSLTTRLLMWQRHGTLLPQGIHLRPGLRTTFVYFESSSPTMACQRRSDKVKLHFNTLRISSILQSLDFERVPGDGYSSNVPGDGYYSNVPGDGYYSNVPDDGYYSNVPGDGYYSNVPDDGYYSNVPGDGYSRNTSCTLNLIRFYYTIF